jgi:integrase
VRARFYIEKRKNENGDLILSDRPVFMSVSFHGKRTMLPTGLKVDLRDWNPESQRIRSSFPDSFSLNARLDAFEENANRTWESLFRNTGDPTVKEFRMAFNERKPKYHSGFLQVYLSFLEQGIDRWSTSTYRKVRTIYRHLSEYETWASTRLEFSQMTEEFLDSFQDFYREKGNNANTTRSAVGILVWFLRWSLSNGFHAHEEFRKFNTFLKKSEEARPVNYYLQWDELEDMSQVECPGRKLGRVRDLFCFMCYSGLNYNELKSLEKGDISKDEILIRKPGRGDRKVPLNDRARNIHLQYENKYYRGNTEFPPISIITFNKYLRMVAQAAGLDRKVPDRKDATQLTPLYSVITAGTAVRTFVFNALELGVPPSLISHYTGVRNDSRIRQIKSEMAGRQILRFDR